MTIKALVTQEDLSQWLGFERKSDIEQWLRSRGIWYDHGKAGRVVTTEAAINAAQRKGQDVGELRFLSRDEQTERH